MFLLGATITTLGLFLQITLVSLPLFTWLHSPLVTVSSSTSTKSLTTSLQLSLGQVRYWPLYQIASPVPLNTSTQGPKQVQASDSRSNSSADQTLKEVQSVKGNATVSKRKRRKGRRRRRRKRSEEDDDDEFEVETPPPPPTPPTPLQVCLDFTSPPRLC